jgi:hypothetical protein
MRIREKTKEMNKHQSPKRSKDLSREKNKQRISLIQISQQRRHLMSGVFYGSDDPGRLKAHLCIVETCGVVVSLKHPLRIESEGIKKYE